MPTKLSIKQRAALFVNQLLADRREWLSGRGPDKCFENGNGKEVVQECLKLLSAKGITSFAQLTPAQQWYVPRDWFSEKHLGPQNQELF